MRQIISNYRHVIFQLSLVSDHVRGTWQDSVGDAFYSDIIQPMKDESVKMSTAMEDLTSSLYHIKEEIDRI